jgi:hypothetical protein
VAACALIKKAPLEHLFREKVKKLENSCGLVPKFRFLSLFFYKYLVRLRGEEGSVFSRRKLPRLVGRMERLTSPCSLGLRTMV